MAKFSTNTCVKYFNTCIRKGQSPFYAVQTLADKYNKTTTFVWNCLCRNNAAFSVKFNGTKCYFPTTGFKYSKSGSNTPESFFWQYAVEYALCRKWVTPAQVSNWTPTQTCWFVCNCFNNQFTRPGNFNPGYTFGSFGKNGSWTNGNYTSSSYGRKLKSKSGKYSYNTSGKYWTNGNYASKRRAA